MFKFGKIFQYSEVVKMAKMRAVDAAMYVLENKNMADPAVLTHRRIERVNSRARHAKCCVNPFFFQSYV
jgi:hypothetical protein